MGDTTTDVDAHEQIREVLVGRMGEYFRPGYSGTWLLNSANLALVVGDIVAAELRQVVDQTVFEDNPALVRDAFRKRADQLGGSDVQ